MLQSLRDTRYNRYVSATSHLELAISPHWRGYVIRDSEVYELSAFCRKPQALRRMPYAACFRIFAKNYTDGTDQKSERNFARIWL